MKLDEIKKLIKNHVKISKDEVKEIFFQSNWNYHCKVTNLHGEDILMFLKKTIGEMYLITMNLDIGLIPSRVVKMAFYF